MPDAPPLRLRRIVPALLVALSLPSLAAWPAPLAGQEAALHHHDGLGSLAFPTSGKHSAQRAFERGVLLMHSFEYEEAAAAFREAREDDPDFALAYWGEAMTHNHPVWNEQDRDAAGAILAQYAPTARARADRAPTARERLYMEAVDVLYGEGPKESRDTAYERAMQRLVEAYPGDFEARAFHALSILGLSQGKRDVPAYMRAGAAALDLFEENPGHPGAAHYVIHSFDDPTHAPLGLDAARAYAGIAPEAAHAQHMTTHIFLALGMWDGVVDANERADAVVDRTRADREQPPTDCGHYNEWLAYGYAQQGRTEDAARLVTGCIQQAHDDPRQAGSAAGMRALYLASTRDLDGTIAGSELDPDRLPPASRYTVLLVQDWATGFAAAGRGDIGDARDRLAAFEARLERGDAVREYWADYPPVWHGTLRAALAAAEGDLDAAIAAAHEAAEYEAALPVDFGPPIAFQPPRELEAELLLDAGRAHEALAAFRMALARTPRRARTLDGFARAAAAVGETALADGARAELLRIREAPRR